MVNIRELFNDWINERFPERNCITESYMAYTMLKILDLPGTITVYESQFFSDYPDGPFHWFAGYKEPGQPETYIDGYQNRITNNIQDLRVHPDSIAPVDFESKIQQYTPRHLIRKLNREMRKDVLVQQIHDRKWLRGLE